MTEPTPSPSPTPFDLREAVESWPSPPTWMLVTLYVLLGIVAVGLILATVAGIASWRNRQLGSGSQQRKEWVDLDSLDVKRSPKDYRD